jgi:TonB-linked SusC/RagA family outer membrane protein
MKKRCKTIKGLLCGIMIFMGLMSGQTLLAQQINITGKVTNVQSKEALVGVTILEKGTTNGTLTDALGKYSIKVANANSILVFTFVGMEPQEVVVGGQKEIDIAMSETVSVLNEVVVTGYGTQRRSDLTGSISVVKVDETKDVASASVLQAIQGRVAGMYITTTGDPTGAATNISIRGLNTLVDANNPTRTSPLYIIDGVPTIDPNVLQNMDQNSIESFQVLKDASATSIYGSRASNGVVIVTTKAGKGKINVELHESYSLQNFARRYDVCNTDQYGRVLWQGAINDAMVNNDNQFNPGVANHNPNNALYNYDWHRDANGVAILDKVRPVQFLGSTLMLGSATPTEYGNGNSLYPSANTNWQDQVFQTGVISQTGLTMSGSTDRTSTLVDIGYFYNKGVIITTGFKKANLRVNNTVNFFDSKLKIGENIMVTRTSDIPTPADAARSVIALASDIIPMMPVYKTDGTFAGPIGAGFSDRANPVGMADVNKNDRNINNGVFGNLFVEIKPIKNLLFRSNIGLEYGLSRVNVYYPKWQEGSLGNSTNYVNLSETESTNWTWSNTLTYQLAKGRSRGSILVGTEAISNLANSMQAKRENFAVDDPSFYYLNAGTGSQTNSGSATASTLLSYFGNLNYVFADKYMLTGTVRYDGSSRFGTNNQFGFFPSGSAAWVISKEEFMKGIGLISNLKLRAGYGIVGNQAIGDYSRFQLWRPDYAGTPGFFGPSGGTAYDINGVDTGTLPSGFRSTQAANNNLKWESTSELNLGLDFGFMSQKITGGFDYFSRDTKNILTTPPILGVMGEGASQTVNGATMQNKGWEFTLGYADKAGDFGYNLNVTLSHFADKITYLPATVVRNYAGNTEQTIIGHSVTSVFGYVTDGLFQNQAEVDAAATQPGKGIGRIRYKDLNNDGKIDQLDQTWLGTTNPKLLYGVTGGLSYKNFSLSFFVRGVYGVLVTDQYKVEKYAFLGSVAGMNKGVSLLNAWTPQNTGSTIPMLSFNNNNNETRTSDYLQSNGSYTKLQTLQLNYDIPQSILSHIKLQSVRVYCSGDNLLVFFQKTGTRAFTGPDPETPTGNFGGYPEPVKVTFGADIKF